MLYRLQHLKMRLECELLWKSRRPITITAPVREAIKVIYDFLVADNKWECPIGHLIPREMTSESYGDSSQLAIGVVSDDIKAIILLPFSKRLCNLLKSGDVHINTMELIALFLAYIMFLCRYENSPEGTFAPHPQIKLWGDSMSANKWFRTFSTNSPMATKALRMFAEYMKYSPVSPVPNHISGIDNVQADDLSRVNKLFTHEKEFIYDVPYTTLLQQVYRKYSKMSNYSVFLPHPEILSDLSSLVYSDSLMEPPKKRKNYGRFFQGSCIFSGSVNSTVYSNSFSL